MAHASHPITHAFAHSAGNFDNPLHGPWQHTHAIAAPCIDRPCAFSQSNPSPIRRNPYRLLEKTRHFTYQNGQMLRCRTSHGTHMMVVPTVSAEGGGRGGKFKRLAESDGAV